ncbi:MAG: ABC transporter ATP-binding protein [Eubacteriales bacterium]|nr:ABC transporter ATP-binding protein [Eubacteriales bacterium]
MLLITLLLIVQAWCALALPGFTSTLVDVGVQQGGIASPAADSLSRKAVGDIMTLLDDAQRQRFEAAYQLENDVYALRQGLNAGEFSALEEDLALPMAILSMLSSDEAPPEAQAALAAMRLGRLDRAAVMERAREMMAAQGGLSSQVTRQMAIRFVRQDYVAQGIDLDALRARFLWRQGIQMLGITALLGLAAAGANFVSSRAAARIGRGLRGQVYTRVLSFSAAEIDKFSTASLITRSTNDITQIQQTSVMMLRMMLYAPILAIGGIWQVAGVRTGMGWIIFAAVGVMAALVVITASVVTPKFKLLQKLIDRMNQVTRENLTGVPVIRAFSRQEHEVARFGKASDDLFFAYRFINRAFSYVMPLMFLVMNGVSVMIVWFGAQGIDAGNMLVGDMIAFISYAMLIIMSFMMITMMSTVMLPRAEVAAQRVSEVLATGTSVKEPEKPSALPMPLKGEIGFHHVSFRYPGSDDEVLYNLNFTIRPGETAAVIGATGTGKSTLLRLIPRFFDPTEGKITLDGVDIRSITLDDLRGQIGYVPQQSALFSGTIQSNIAYGDMDMSQESVEEAARLAQAESFILEKAHGYEDDIAQGGSNVSGGQKQRLSIARALAMKPKVLLFDDSFSALDYRTDLAVRRGLKNSFPDTTVLIVAQRIATVMHADRILVIDEGRLVGEGTHEELMATSEPYQQIAYSQLSEEDLAQKGGGRHE